MVALINARSRIKNEAVTVNIVSIAARSEYTALIRAVTEFSNSVTPTKSCFFRHSRELVTTEQAEKWWDIRRATEAKLVAITA